ncbi:hypothetical protein NX059_002795 [Plenodomus lindquistii]|nr:hypothetical protein NX059_002795 [Plenodomus lindquistii]
MKNQKVAQGQVNPFTAEETKAMMAAKDLAQQQDRKLTATDLLPTWYQAQFVEMYTPYNKGEASDFNFDQLDNGGPSAQLSAYDDNGENDRVRMSSSLVHQLFRFGHFVIHHAAIRTLEIRYSKMQHKTTRLKRSGGRV